MRTPIPALGGLALAATLALAAPPATGQTREHGWWDWAAPQVYGGQSIRTSRGTVITLPRRDGDVVIGVPDRAEPRRGGRGGGPPFCRNGQGHPVHGWRWCVEKGFAGPRWRRGDWGDIVLRWPRASSGVILDRRSLGGILGDILLGRLEADRRRLHADGPVVGRWFHTGTGRAVVLQLRAGETPIAELTDLDRDGRPDIVLLNAGE